MIMGDVKRSHVREDTGYSTANACRKAYRVWTLGLKLEMVIIVYISIQYHE